MLLITVPTAPEGWDEKRQEFVEPKYQRLQLEHSLVSLSKWESKWHKSFLGTKEKTYEETIDYIKCMTITPHVAPEVYGYITAEQFDEINRYIKEPMTATYFFGESEDKRSNDKVTAELIYYWMVSLNIPFQCEKWHLNRLLTLIRVCNVKNTPPKKRSRKDIMRRNAALNEQRKKQWNTKG